MEIPDCLSRYPSTGKRPRIMNNITVAYDASNLIGSALAKSVSGLSHFVCDRLKRDVKHNLTLAARFRRYSCGRIEKHHFATSERKPQARPRCLMVEAQPFTYAA